MLSRTFTANFGTVLASASASGALGGGDGLVLVHGARSNGNFGFLYDAQPAFDGNVLTPLERVNNQATTGGALLKYRTQVSKRVSVDPGRVPLSYLHAASST